MLTDVHAHLGTWPFALQSERNPAQLVAHLRAHGIGRAWVSPLAAVLAPDPGPANRALFAALKKTPALMPVPAINPALANWRDELAACAAAAPLRAVKILPNYHNYSLALPALDPFVTELRARKIRLLLQVRLEDERHRYFALQIKGVPVASIVAFLQRFPEVHPLLLGAYLPELRTIAESAKNFSTDCALAEWEQTMVALREFLPVTRIFFGSHTPFLVTGAQTEKLRSARIAAAAKRAIGAGNAARFISS